MGDDADTDRGSERESRARTHLANEATFLSWFRTALALIAVGLAAAQLLTVRVIPGVPVARAIALALVAGGMSVALAGYLRYRSTARGIEAGEFRPARPSIVVVTVLLLLIGVLSILFIVALRG